MERTGSARERGELRVMKSIAEGGYWRAREAAKPRIAAEVAALFADELGDTRFPGRIWVLLRMKLEVRRRLRRAAPPGAHYFFVESNR